jgi:hypothetical protein
MDDLHLISSPLSPERRLDLVFVHGLGGHPFSTWSSGEEGSASWPHWLAEEFGPQIGVWSLGYTTANPLQRLGVKQWFSGKPDPQGGAAMPLPNRAVNALERLAQAGIGQRPVCFIAHSLGGLLVKSILRRADAARDTPQWRKLIEHCRGVLFLATPHQGSVLADLVNVFRIILPTVNTDDLRDNDANLMELYYWYRDHAAGHNIRTLSYFEAKPCQAGVLVVTPSSADPGVSGPLARPPIPLDRDHLQISKPRDRSDLAYIGSKDLIERILAESSPAPTPSSTVVVRSFLASENDNAETLIDFTDLFVCANSRDRRPKHPDVWTQELPSRLAAAAATIERLPKPVILATLTHLSIAWHLGSLLHPKRGVPILLRQRSSASLDALWDGSQARLPAAGATWTFERRFRGEGGDLALVVSATHNALHDAEHAIGAMGLCVREIHHAQLPNPGSASIQDGGHARWLADTLTSTLREVVVQTRPGRLHLFPACPVAFAFLLGQQADALGPTTVYEFSFNHPSRRYQPGMAS